MDDLCFGDPRYVVAQTLASLTAFGGPIHYIDAWMNAANYRKDRIVRLYAALFLVDPCPSTARTQRQRAAVIGRLSERQLLAARPVRYWPPFH